MPGEKYTKEVFGAGFPRPRRDADVDLVGGTGRGGGRNSRGEKDD